MSGAGEDRKAFSSLKGQVETAISPTLLEAVPDAMVVVNSEGIIVHINTLTEDMFGYAREELIGQKVELLIPEELRPQHQHHRDRFAQQPSVRRMGANLELYGRRMDGSQFPVEISLSPVRTSAGQVVLSAIRDISERKRIEAELRRAHEALERRRDRQLWEYQNRLALTVDSSQDAIIGKNLEGIITSWNRGAQEIYGYSAEEVIGRPISLLAPPERQDEIPGILERIRHGERVDYFESVRVAKDGHRLNVSISVSPVHDPEGNIVGASAIARDITAQKRAEDQLRQAQKMEAVGRLAGGVAHDFNNILGIITASCELLSGRAGVASTGSAYIDNIRKAAERGAILTRQLLAFSRRQPIKLQILDLNERLKEVSRLVRPLMGDDVKITVATDSSPAIVEADPGQIDQIILNLAVNSRDAMPRGGKLILETAVRDLDRAFADLHPPLTAGRYVMLAVSDSGVGMDQATIAHIFEPFFTTKESGKGTGLGLSTVYGIVQQAGGHIWVYSEPGRGTTFRVYLPSAEAKVGGASGAEEEALPPRREGTTVLLVEDDSMMRMLTRQMLEDHGYRVLEADSGQAALEQVSSSDGEIDLTLTDVVMQGMTGPELVLKLTETNPSMKVLFMSGYTGELLGDGGTGAITLLEKPFTRTTLLKAVDTALS
jgi:two-component system, cell cycle sensor histidine kinase and response regulator CckA